MTAPDPKILIVKLSAIGDVVHTLPALNGLRRHFPQAHITWLIEEAAADLVIDHPALDRVLISKRKTWLKGLGTRNWTTHLKEALNFGRKLRDTNYDMVFDFQAALKGAVLISLIRARRKIGFDGGMEHQEHSYLVLNERIPPVSMELHALVRGMKMLEAVGINCDEIRYELPIGDIHRQRARQLLAESEIDPAKSYGVINPVAKWPTKLWRVSRFAQVADRLTQDFGLPVVFSGAAEDGAAIDEIVSKMEAPAANLAGQTDLITLAALLERARLMITTDTGPMHIAAAVATPTVALFGPTAARRTGPFGKRHKIVKAERDCSPCFKRNCSDKSGCMDDISVAQVISAANDILIINQGLQ